MAADVLHRAVPLVETPDPKSIVRTCDFLLSQVLKHERAVLRAGAKEAPPEKSVAWFVGDQSGLPVPTDENVIYMSHPAGPFPFRSLLGRFGASYMPEGCLYGGSAQGTLFHEQETFGYSIVMSNSGQTGFWIRINTWRLDASSSTLPPVGMS